MRTAFLTLLAACSSPPGSGSAGAPDPTGGDSAGAADSGEVASDAPWCADPAEALAYRDVGPEWGLVDTTDSDPKRMEAGPVASLDLDGDGLDEIIVGVREAGLILHRNAGGSFSTAPLLEAPDLTGIALGDIDGDGDLDLWAGGYAPRMWLLRNDGEVAGKWVFSDITEEAGLLALSTQPQKMDASFGDFDLDGDLDLYINHAGPPGTMRERELDKLLRNDGTGRFEEVSAWFTAEQRQGTSWSPTWTDLDGDLDPDLFVANADQAMGGPSLLLRNDGPSGEEHRFTDLSSTCGCTNNFNPMGVSPADYDNDGDQDLFLTNTDSDQLLRNEGDFLFVDVSASVGAMELPTNRHMTFGSVWVDLDNNGWLDLMVSSGPLAPGPEPGLDDQPDRVLFNLEGVAFENRAEELGMANRGAGRGVTRVLLDDDGYPELLVGNIGSPSRLWHTPCLANRALVVELRQESGNTRGIGAWVTVSFADGTQQVQEISAKPGWGGAMEPRAWFGLGTKSVDGVSVRWPDGGVTEVDVAAGVDGRLRVER